MRKKFVKGFSANVIFLGIVSLINDFSSELIVPILPLLITSLGGTGIIVGLVGGIRDSVASIIKFYFGHESDKIRKRKPFIVSGYLTSATLKLFLSLSKTWQHVLIFSGLERLGKGMRTAPIDALISESMPKNKGKGFGIHRTLDTTGAVLGAITAFILFWYFDFSFKKIIFIAAILGFLAIIPLIFVKEKKKKKKVNHSIKWEIKKLPKQVKLFILIASVFALANFSYMFFILKAKDFLPGKLGLAIPILLYVFFNLFYLSFAIPMGNLSDHIGRKRVLIYGYLLFSFLTLGFIFANSITAFIILFALYGLVYAMIEGNQRALVSDLSSEEHRGAALGLFHTCVGVTALPASLIAGLLWDINPNLTFAFGSLLSLISVLLFISLKKYIRKQ